VPTRRWGRRERTAARWMRGGTGGAARRARTRGVLTRTREGQTARTRRGCEMGGGGGVCMRTCGSGAVAERGGSADAGSCQGRWWRHRRPSRARTQGGGAETRSGGGAAVTFCRAKQAEGRRRVAGVWSSLTGKKQRGGDVDARRGACGVVRSGLTLAERRARVWEVGGAGVRSGWARARGGAGGPRGLTLGEGRARWGKVRGTCVGVGRRRERGVRMFKWGDAGGGHGGIQDTQMKRRCAQLEKIGRWRWKWREWGAVGS
jgi:hypothetical protein